MVIGIAVNQRQFEGADTTAVAIITKQFNQVSPENALKFQPAQPAADRYTFDAALVELHATGLNVMFSELYIKLPPNTPRGADA